MRKNLLPIFVLLFAFIVCAPAVYAQGAAKSGPDPSTIRDPELEKDSLHNLEVARLYFKLRKAYVAAIKRCEEIIAGNPNFTRMDEVLFIAGESSFRLSENKGKQTSKHTPEQLRDDSRNYLTQLVDEYPQSDFSKQAQESLRALGDTKPKTEKESKP
jgi:outer membrane protein assembly factor BamD (BamD/ComL family)